MEYRVKIQQIRASYQHGHITLEQAEDLVNPLLEEMNKKGAVIAKQYGKTYKKLTFGYVFR